MKTIFPVIALLFVSQFARASDFKATPIYCNGPVTNGNVSNCPAFSAWMGVQLKNLNQATLPVEPEGGRIRLVDSDGHSWETTLESCQSKLSDLRGCNAKVDRPNLSELSIHITTWAPGRRSSDLGLFVKNGELSLVSNQGDSLVFALQTN